MSFDFKGSISIGSYTFVSTFDNNGCSRQFETVLIFYGTFDSYFLCYKPKREKTTEDKRSDFTCIIHTFICFNGSKVSISFVMNKRKFKY